MTDDLKPQTPRPPERERTRWLISSADLRAMHACQRAIGALEARYGTGAVEADELFSALLEVIRNNNNKPGYFELILEAAILSLLMGRDAQRRLTEVVAAESRPLFRMFCGEWLKEYFARAPDGLRVEGTLSRRHAERVMAYTRQFQNHALMPLVRRTLYAYHLHPRLGSVGGPFGLGADQGLLEALAVLQIIAPPGRASGE